MVHMMSLFFNNHMQKISSVYAPTLQIIKEMSKMRILRMLDH
jgi:hypothetical protein